MELILNIFWLMLVLPAYWLWRREGQLDHSCPRFGSLRSVLVLGCALMLLFPVVSATDDLHFIRPDIEECGPSKRTLKHAGGEKASTWVRVPISLCQAIETAPSEPADDHCEGVFVHPATPFSAVFVDTKSDRAPPLSFLA